MTATAQSQPRDELQGNVTVISFARSLEGGRGARPYLITPDRVGASQQLAERAGQIANFLKSIGIKPGERSCSVSSTGRTFRRCFWHDAHRCDCDFDQHLSQAA